MKTEYVIGFVFDHKKERVVLITKNRPAWQAGLKNGVGGHIEENESPHEAIQREFAEEATRYISKSLWEKFHVMEFEKARVHCFRFFLGEEDTNFTGIISNEEEPISVNWISQLDYTKTIPNLEWLIPMALDPEPMGIR